MCLKTLEIQREREGGEGVMLGPARVRVERRMEVGGEGEAGKMGQIEGSEGESKGEENDVEGTREGHNRKGRMKIQKEGGGKELGEGGGKAEMK